MDDRKESSREPLSLGIAWASRITALALGFVLPILAGIDKSLHLLVNWDQYLSPVIAGLLPVDGHLFMQIVGVIEIVAGILVFFKPRIGGGEVQVVVTRGADEAAGVKFAKWLMTDEAAALLTRP